MQLNRPVSVLFPKFVTFRDILIDDKLTVSQHICALVKKARTRASLIFKCFHYRHRATLLKAFITYVRLLLEYATPVWSPYMLTDILGKQN